MLKSWKKRPWGGPPVGEMAPSGRFSLTRETKHEKILQSQAQKQADMLAAAQSKGGNIPPAPHPVNIDVNDPYQHVDVSTVAKTSQSSLSNVSNSANRVAISAASDKLFPDRNRLSLAGVSSEFTSDPPSKKPHCEIIPDRGLGAAEPQSLKLNPIKWGCGKCNYLNFSNSEKCNKCGVDKGSKDTTSSAQSGRANWECLNCHFLNFTFRTCCFECKLPKGSKRADNSGSKDTAKRDETTENIPGGNVNIGIGRLLPAVAGDGDSQNGATKIPGGKNIAVQWECTKCQSSNFDRRVNCWKCNTSRSLCDGGLFEQPELAELAETAAAVLGKKTVLKQPVINTAGERAMLSIEAQKSKANHADFQIVESSKTAGDGEKSASKQPTINKAGEGAMLWTEAQKSKAIRSYFKKVESSKTADTKKNASETETTKIAPSKDTEKKGDDAIEISESSDDDIIDKKNDNASAASKTEITQIAPSKDTEKKGDDAIEIAESSDDDIIDITDERNKTKQNKKGKTDTVTSANKTLPTKVARTVKSTSCNTEGGKEREEEKEKEMEVQNGGDPIQKIPGMLSLLPQVPHAEYGGSTGPDKSKHNNAEETAVKGKYARFRDFSLKPDLLRAIVDSSLEHPSEIQQKIIPPAISGVDVICQTRIDLGKTVTLVSATLHQIQPIDKQVSVLVVSHSNESCKQIKGEYERFSKYLTNIKVALFLGGLSFKRDKQVLETNCPHIVVGTPGRVLALVRYRALNLLNLKHFILDGVGEMLEQLDTRSDVQEIFRSAPHKKQVMMFSSTLNKEIRPLCKKFTQDPLEVYDDQTKLT